MCSLPRPRSFLEPLSITRAGAAHNCRHSDNHRIKKGDLRLTVQVERAQQHYCVSCAIAFLDKDAAKLADLLGQIRLS